MILHFLALDTVFAVVLWAILGGLTFGVFLEAGPLLWTGSAVWLVYCADRWFDSLPQSRETHLGGRHHFMVRNRVGVATCWVLVWLVSLGSALVYLPARALLVGGVFTVIALVYLILTQTPSKRAVDSLPPALMSLIVGTVVASASLLFPFLLSGATISETAPVWSLFVGAFWVQAFVTRLWESPGKNSIVFPVTVGLLLSAIALYWNMNAVALGLLSLFLALAIFNKAGPNEKVCWADWILGGSAGFGILAHFILHN
ncbi:MAG: hypothetical protein AAGJ81_15820 [Verrucomicrobiota bacterium]